MPKIHPHPFDCEECKTHAPEEFQHFKPTDDWLIVYPEKKQIHMHFGGPTINEEQHLAETEWICKWTLNNWLPKHADIEFFIYVDMTRSNDSEYPAEESMALYKKMMQHPQNSMTVFYGSTQAMKFFINMLMRFSKTYKKIRLVDTKKQADELYEKWTAKQ